MTSLDFLHQTWITFPPWGTSPECLSGWNIGYQSRLLNITLLSKLVLNISGTDADPKILVDNLFYSPPETKYAQKMSQKSKITVLALDLEDPSTSQGMINVSRKLVQYIPTLPSSKKQKCPVFGDQGFFEKGWSPCLFPFKALSIFRISCFMVLVQREESRGQTRGFAFYATGVA